VGVAEAWLFFQYLCSMPFEGTAVSQSFAPVDRLYAIIDIVAPSFVAVVRNR